MLGFPWSRAPTERVVVGFAGAHANGAFHVEHEDLAVADLVGLGGGCDRVDDLFGHAVGHNDFELDFRHEIHGIFGAAVDFGVTGLRAEALDLGHHHAAHADGGQGFADLLQLERLDCCDDEFHVSFPSLFVSSPNGRYGGLNRSSAAAKGNAGSDKRCLFEGRIAQIVRKFCIVIKF